MPEWISVKDKLPSENGTYLAVYRNERIYMGYFRDGKWMIEGVTHWMYLPKLPNGGTAN